ncbi:MAG: hypothetical protein HDS82_03995 [Bacteroidales bacterium]|nr:hypothetical protein [Bacteroidales bacterium]
MIKANMKCCVIICDGMADEPSESAGGLTPLEAACTPAMDRLAAISRCGLVNTIPDGFYAGSEVGILSILGYPSSEIPGGRGFLEAVGSDIYVSEHDTVARYNQLPEEESISSLTALYPELRFHPVSSHAGIVIGAGCDIPVGEEHNTRFWSHSCPHSLSEFPPMPTDGCRREGVIIGAVPLLKGIAKLAGMRFISPPHATGNLDTDYSEKSSAAIEALKKYDIVILHIEACDTASHLRDFNLKKDAIEKIDRHVVHPILEFAKDYVEPTAIALLPDHRALWETGKHNDSPVPVIIYDPCLSPDNVTAYSEKEASKGTIRNLNPLYRLYGKV